MKKSIFLLSCLFIVNCLYSQDIAPSSQAQGYLENKNVTVDYATGIFNYRVPLYTLGSGGFSLPISLDYAARGVKVSDLPGLLGFNWTLNTGGVVTRTVRGGIADEEFNSGYLWGDYVSEPVPLKDDQKKVHQHMRDGECDIFTAVFNAQSVNFIIRMNAGRQVYAEPLEQTGVRIECETAPGPVIEGWVVTDELGNRYIYRQKEWSTGFYQEEAISFNGLRDKSYTSSWYLSRIEPINGSPVVFNYRPDIDTSSGKVDYGQTKYSNEYTSTYQYGRPLSEHLFNFEKYRKDFEAEINMAKSYLTDYSWELQVNNPLTIYAGSREWVVNPDFGTGVTAFNDNFRIMGQLGDFKNITKASDELIQVLDNLYQTYISSGSRNAKMAAECFRFAKELVIQSLEEVDNNITQRKVSNLTTSIVHSPTLDNICCCGKVLKFGYVDYDFRYLKSLKLCDVSGKRISEVTVTGVGPVSSLGDIRFMDKDSVEIQRIGFEYYKRPADNYKIDYDICGYPISADYDWKISDSLFLKISSLKVITLPDGGKINLDYERNQVGIPSRLDSLNSRRANRYCGIRLKSLIFAEATGQPADTIYYRYPLPGFWVYESVSSQEEVQYQNFTDQVISSRAKYKGLAFLNSGNNGLYYRYVEEIVPGHGTQVYHFHVPLINATAGYEFYPFWLTALPLGVASYDKNGNLKRLVKNKYITSWDFDNQIADWTSYVNRDYFVFDNRFLYNRNLPQVKAYEYYMDADYLESFYRNQGNLVLYRDRGYVCTMNPYRDVYLHNIEPRTKIVLPKCVYSLCYGGKTLLQRQSEYHFDHVVTAQPDISDFSKEASGMLYTQTEYFYDYPAGSLSPTRIVTTDSRGDVYTTLTKRVSDMSDGADAGIARMKVANMKALPVKEIHMKNNLLQQEKVFCYTVSDSSGRCFAGVKEQWTYRPEVELSVSATFPDPVMFTYDPNKYVQDGEYRYWQDRDFFLPVEVKKRSGKEAVCYDFNTGRTILQVPHGNVDMIMAVDCEKNMNPGPDDIPGIASYKDIFDSFRILSRDCRVIASVSNDPNFQNFTQNRKHKIVSETIDALVGLDTVNFKRYVNSTSISGFFYEFLDWYFFQSEQYGEYINVDRFQRVLPIVQNAIDYPEIFTPDFWSFAYNYTESIPDEAKEMWILKNFAGNTGCKMYVLTQKHVKVYYTVSHRGGVTRKYVETENTSYCSVQSFDIDLSSYEGLTSVTIQASSSDTDIAYLAFLPADAEFEATSYNVDGSVFAKFDQTGHLELNEYDSGGRLIRVRDGKGNIVQEYQYNVATN